MPRWTWLMPGVSVLFAVLFFIPVLLPLFFFLYPVPCAVLGVLYLPSYLDRVESDPSRTRRTLFLLHSPLWWAIRDWFRMTLRSSDAAVAAMRASTRRGRRRLWGLHPHGVDTFQLAAVTSELCGFGDLFGATVPYPRLAAASAVLRLPVIRDIFLSYGTIEASRGTLQTALRAGHDVALVTGGSQEVLLMSPGDDVVYLSRRRGFVRLALEEGVDLVPTWTFAANDAFSQLSWPPWRRAMSAIVSRLKIVVPVYWGIAGTPVPFRVTQTVVVGAPIPVTRAENPTDAQVSALHKRYIAALVALHEEHKGRLGFADRTLRVV